MPVRALREETGGAEDVAVEHGGRRTRGGRAARIRRPEEGHDRRSDGRGQVHRAGVVRDEQTPALQERSEADGIQVGSEDGKRSLRGARDGDAEGGLVRARDDRARIPPLGEQVAEGRESSCPPTLRRVLGASRRQQDEPIDRVRQARRAQGPVRQPSRFLGQRQPGRVGVRRDPVRRQEGVEAEVFVTAPGARIADDHPLVASLGEAHAEVFGSEPERDVTRWFSDASVLTRYGIETVNYGTSSGLPDAELGENLAIDGLVKTAEVYARAAMKVCGVA